MQRRRGDEVFVVIIRSVRDAYVGPSLIVVDDDDIWTHTVALSIEMAFAPDFVAQELVSISSTPILSH